MILPQLKAYANIVKEHSHKTNCRLYSAAKYFTKIALEIKTKNKDNLLKES